MLSRRCDLPVRAIGSMAGAGPAARARPVPAATADCKNWRRVAVMAANSPGQERAPQSHHDENRTGREVPALSSRPCSLFVRAVGGLFLIGGGGRPLLRL